MHALRVLPPPSGLQWEFDVEAFRRYLGPSQALMTDDDCHSAASQLGLDDVVVTLVPFVIFEEEL